MLFPGVMLPGVMVPGVLLPGVMLPGVMGLTGVPGPGPAAKRFLFNSDIAKFPL